MLVAIARPKARELSLYLAVVLLPFLVVSARADVCVELARGNLRDTSYSFSDQEHFSELKRILKQSNFKDYKQWSSGAQSLGLDVPMAEGMIGFSAAAKDDSGQFRKELNDFLNATYEQAYSRMKSINSTATFNAQVLSVLDRCVDVAYRRQEGTYVSAVANSAANFTVTIDITRSPSNPGQTVKVLSVQPQGLISCKPPGAAQMVGLTIEQSSLLVECTKSPTDTVNGFSIQTTVGVSRPIVLYAQRVADPTPKPILAEWKTDAITPPERPSCSCVSGYMDPSGPTLVIGNKCKVDLVIKAMRDPDKNNPPQVPPFAPTQGRHFSQLVLSPGQEGHFRGPANSGVLVGFSGCPDPVPPPQLTCFMPKVVFQQRGKPWERTWCALNKQTPLNGERLAPCSCDLGGEQFPGCFAVFPADHTLQRCP